jgi:hypothetical protein
MEVSLCPTKEISLTGSEIGVDPLRITNARTELGQEAELIRQLVDRATGAASSGAQFGSLPTAEQVHTENDSTSADLIRALDQAADAIQGLSESLRRSAHAFDDAEAEATSAAMSNR